MESLFSGFPPVSLSEWKARLVKDLKGKTFEDLTVRNESNIPVFPFYNTENTVAPGDPLKQHPGWETSISLPVAAGKEAQARDIALHALSGGASGLIFDMPAKGTVGIPRLLQDIELPYIHTVFRLGNSADAFTDSFYDYLKEKKANPEALDCHICFDPIARYLRQPDMEPAFSGPAYNAFAQSAGSLFTVDADGSVFQNAGAHPAFQLAGTLSMLNEYLHALEGTHIQQIRITLAAGTDFFSEIAKLRALRKLLPLLQEAYAMQPEIQVHVVTSDIYRAPFDRYNNLLRDTLSAMAGILGGCDSLEIHRFDQDSLQAQPDFSDRMRRNQQLIFKEESYLHKVADIPAGSFYLETLTEETAKKAWSHFQKIEQEGGLLTCFKKGILQKEIGQQADHLMNEYRTGKRILVGVNKFPNPEDKPRKETGRQTVPAGNGLQPLSIATALL